MNTKLTLTLEKEVIDQAKKYASDKGRSLSEMVESYFRYVTESGMENVESEQLSPRIKNLRGVLKVDSNFDYRNRLNEEKDNKHGI